MGGASVFGTVNVTGTKGKQLLTMGDLGSKVLPPTDPKDVPSWKRGSTPQVAWGMRFNVRDSARVFDPRLDCIPWSVPQM